MLVRYCSLLARGNDFHPTIPPPPTAPNAIRHWTSSQKELLSHNQHPKGTKLLQLQTQQSQSWNTKYETLSSSHQTKFSKEVFLWAMEAVHSRAFCGDFGPTVSIGRTPILVSGIIQVLAITLGVQSLLSSTQQDGFVAVCTLVAILPIIVWNFVLGGGGDGVLLPMIDSANHLADADSRIEYDPFQDGFGLTLGRNCQGSEGQVYISYGTQKSDSELLLNYGFLPNVTTEMEVDGKESYRSQLAEAYTMRN